MSRGFSIALGEYYHVYNRGIDKRNIFESDEDKDRFQKLLYLCNGSLVLDMRALPPGPAYSVNTGNRLTSIGAYALMDNHFHLLLKETREGGISAFMQKLGTSHTKFFNLKNERSGRLYEGTFKAVHVKNDNHLKRLLSYIHINPIALLDKQAQRTEEPHVQTLNNLAQFKFSSYQDHLGHRRVENEILKLEVFPSYFKNIEEYEQDMLGWLTLDYES